MKKSLLLLSLFFLSFSVIAQKPLMIQGSEKGFYLSHTVAPKESFYSIGRLYAIPPKDIATFNELDMNHGLNIGQLIKIPLTSANFSQVNNTGKPVYYVVGQKEGLYRVSQKNGTVLMADLRKWNKLTTDVIKPGQKLIVGYLAPSEPAPVAVTPPVKENSTEEKKEEEKPKTPEPEKNVQAETKPEKKVETITPPAPVATPVRKVTSEVNDSYFRGQYEQQSRSANSNKEHLYNSGIFKTASGWQDGKFYVLADNIEPGTIVKVSNPVNGKVIYAKVLGGMSGVRQNQGYDMRISNAAASMLDVTDTEKFVVKLNY